MSCAQHLTNQDGVVQKVHYVGGINVESHELLVVKARSLSVTAISCCSAIPN